MMIPSCPIFQTNKPTNQGAAPQPLPTHSTGEACLAAKELITDLSHQYKEMRQSRKKSSS